MVTERRRGDQDLACDPEHQTVIGAVGSGSGAIADAVDRALAPDQSLKDDAALLVIGRP